MKLVSTLYGLVYAASNLNSSSTRDSRTILPNFVNRRLTMDLVDPVDPRPIRSTIRIVQETESD